MVLDKEEDSLGVAGFRLQVAIENLGTFNLQPTYV
jgi:hypothetical protein